MVFKRLFFLKRNFQLAHTLLPLFATSAPLTGCRNATIGASMEASSCHRYLSFDMTKSNIQNS